MKKILVQSLFIVFLLFPSFLLAASGWEPCQAITSNEVMDQFPSIAITKGDIPVVACNEIIPGKKYDIVLFQNLQSEWKMDNITQTPLVSDYQPIVKADSQGNIHVLFLSRLADRKNKLFIFHTFYKNGQWSESSCITLDKKGVSPESRPAAAIDNHDVLHMVFHDDDGKLYYSNCSDGKWSPKQDISNKEIPICWAPSITFDTKGKLHLIYLGGEQGNYTLIYQTYYQGLWSEPEIINKSISHPWRPSLAVDGKGVVYIAYACDTPLKRKISLIKGQSGAWNLPEKIMDHRGDFDNTYLLADTRGYIHLVFNGGTGGNEGPYEIYYSNNIQGLFSNPVALTNDNIFQYQPVLAMDSKGYGHLVYYGFDGFDTEIYYQKSLTPLYQMRNPSATSTFTNYTAHRKRYLPPLDINYIPSESTCLRGKKITLSAGHGGLAHLSEYRWGATNTREDELNLQVALFLKEYLEKADVTVYMCRTTDIDVDLDERPALANATQSDLFVSIHHNSFDFYSNYACVYFHGNPVENPQSLDLSNLVTQKISGYLNIPDKGSMSDYFSYWNSGYAELRGLRGVPGILGEGSHFYCFDEEEQLRNLDYLKRQSYAYFRGIIDWYSQPQPSAVLLEPSGDIPKGIELIKIQLEDGVSDSVYKINPSSISMQIDGNEVLFEYDWKNGIITYKAETPLPEGNHQISLLFETFSKVHSPIIHFNLTVKP